MTGVERIFNLQDLDKVLDAVTVLVFGHPSDGQFRDIGYSPRPPPLCLLRRPSRPFHQSEPAERRSPDA